MRKPVCPSRKMNCYKEIKILNQENTINICYDGGIKAPCRTRFKGSRKPICASLIANMLQSRELPSVELVDSWQTLKARWRTLCRCRSTRMLQGGWQRRVQPPTSLTGEHEWQPFCASVPHQCHRGAKSHEYRQNCRSTWFTTDVTLLTHWPCTAMRHEPWQN